MLGFMASDYFRNSPMLSYPLLALAIFMLVFLVVTLRTVLTGKQRFEGLAALPLQDEEGAHTSSSAKEVGRG